MEHPDKTKLEKRRRQNEKKIVIRGRISSELAEVVEFLNELSDRITKLEEKDSDNGKTKG